MPLDPQECRRQALACVRLAQTSSSPQARLHYANLAKTWLTLAGDLDERHEPWARLDFWCPTAPQAACRW